MKWTWRLLSKKQHRKQVLSLRYDLSRFQEHYWEQPCRSINPRLSSKKHLRSFVLEKTPARPRAICFRRNLSSASLKTLNSDTLSLFKEWPSVMACVTGLRTDPHLIICYSQRLLLHPSADIQCSLSDQIRRCPLYLYSASLPRQLITISI